MNDGCDACTIEEGWCCENNDCSPVCGDGKVVGDEKCDYGSGPVDSDTAAGCVNCQVASGFACPSANDCNPVPGDGAVHGSEECDDNNTAVNDGCDATGLVEEGWTCTREEGALSTCEAICGDGLLKDDE